MGCNWKKLLAPWKFIYFYYDVIFSLFQFFRTRIRPLLNHPLARSVFISFLTILSYIVFGCFTTKAKILDKWDSKKERERKIESDIEPFHTRAYNSEIKNVEANNNSFILFSILLSFSLFHFKCSRIRCLNSYRTISFERYFILLYQFWKWYLHRWGYLLHSIHPDWNWVKCFHQSFFLVHSNVVVSGRWGRCECTV